MSPFQELVKQVLIPLRLYHRLDDTTMELLYLLLGERHPQLQEQGLRMPLGLEKNPLVVGMLVLS
jgi:hypothetical protein